MNCGGNCGFMQIQEFFLDFVRVQDFSVDLSSVDMDNFIPMIIFILV